MASDSIIPLVSRQDLGGRSRFAKLGMATNYVLIQTYRDILETEVPPSDIEKNVRASTHFYQRLRPEQKQLLIEAKHSGYECFDISLTYQLIRNICKKIPKPTKGKWGEEPAAAGEVTVGDDVERIRSIRNRLTLHMSSASIPQEEFNNTWSTMSDICQRLENFTGKKYLDNLNDVKKLTIRREEEDFIIRIFSMEHQKMLKTLMSDVQEVKSDLKCLRKKDEDEVKEKIEMGSYHEMLKANTLDVQELKAEVLRSESKHAVQRMATDSITPMASGQDLGDRSRFAKLGMATNDVLNQAYRDILEMEVPPSVIFNKVKASSVYKRLGPEQEQLLIDATHSGYKNFNVSLTYTLIRNICKMIPKPTKGKWGVQPAAGEVTVGDDIERIRLIRNNLTAYVSSASTPEAEFNDTWSKMTDICKRLETFTGKKYLDQLKLIQKMTFRGESETEDDVIEMIKMVSQHEMVKAINSELKSAVMRSESKHDVHVQKIATGRTRFAKLGMATNDVLNQAYRDILEMEVPPSEIENKVKASSMYKILRPEQEHTLKEAKHSGYRNFDFSLTYTLIRNICKMIPKPTKGKWGVQPAAGEVTVGDDIERIRLIRNSLTAHVSSASISQTEFDDTWTAMSDICQRLETFTGKKYLDKLNDIKKLILKKEDEEDIIKKEIERQHEMMKEIFLHSDIQALSPRSKSMHEMELQEQFKMHTSKEERSSRRYIHFGNTRPATKGEQIKSGAIQIRKKSEEKTKGHQRTSCWTEKTFDKKLEQLKESENYEFRIQRLISFLNIETFNLSSIQRDHMENNDFKDIIERVGYLDCSGLYFSKAEKQSKSFKPFSQSSVWDFLKWITDFNKVFRKTQSPKCRLVLSILFSAYATKEMLEFKPRDLSSIIDRLLECAIENQNHILILEIVRSYLLDFDFHLCKLFKDKNRISSVMDTFLTPALYIILRECPRLQQNAIRLSFCCECSKESRLVIMMLYKGSIEMKDGIPEKVMGVNLVLYNYTQPSDEAHTVFNSSSASLSSTNLPVIAENDARKLFKKHSNLTVISASPYKSSGYSKGKHVIVEKHCFSLLCLHKGFIPFGEREFPKQINGFEVDVQEGYCSLGSGKSIDFGGHIRRARGINTPGHGSIGGFVDLPNGSVGLITCAHVVFSTAELFKPYSEIENDVLSRNTDLNVEFFDKHEHHFQVCGNIVKKCFPTSNNDISVDAALIELDQSVNKIGFPVALADQLYLAGFEPSKPPTFTGEVVSLPDPETGKSRSSDVLQRSRIPGRLNSVIKYGSETRFTIGNFYFERVHIRFLNETLHLPDEKGFATMYNQIEIQSLPHGSFFKAGDSGAFVFCINPDKTLSCLGMAIGSNTKGSCLVTPMTRILDSFKLPHRLKPCSPSVATADQSPILTTTNLEALLSNFQTNMQRSMVNMQNALQTEIGNLRTEVRETNEKIETKMDNLKTKNEK